VSGVAEPAATVNAFAPGVAPRVHDVLAVPVLSVKTDVCETVPLPLPGVKFTATPGTAVPNWSSTRTTTGAGSAPPATIVWLPPLTSVSWSCVAVAFTVTVEVADAADTCSVFGPSVALSAQTVRAVPEASVATTDGTTVPFPAAGVKVTATPTAG